MTKEAGRIRMARRRTEVDKDRGIGEKEEDRKGGEKYGDI